jgi:hypothetical protein
MPLTFTCSVDDGHPSDMKMAELFDRHGLTASFYIPVKNREGMPVMSAAQMRELSACFEIGSHTLDHCYLANISPPQARYQILEGKQRLENILGKSVSGFCYPGGKYRQKHIALVKQAGFSYARTTTNLCFDAGTNRFEMPTTCQFYPHAKSVYLRNFIRGGQWHRRQSGLYAALSAGNWLDRMYALFEHARKTEAVFHLWMHSHNIDDWNIWSELDAFLAHVASHVSPDQRISNGQLAARVFATDGSAHAGILPPSLIRL